MELFRIGFIGVDVIDLVDVALVSFILYRLYLVMRGTVAAQIFFGLVLILAFSFLAQTMGLHAMGWILRTLRDIWVIAFIVLFQPELRRLFVIVGRSPLVRSFIKLNVDDSVDSVVGAVGELSKKKYGALIAFERATGLRTFAETGTKLEALVSKSLLLSIFNPKGPLHDGAVIIKDRLIEAAQVILPLSGTTSWDGQMLGTRHRAALGISEQADVVVVLVSEENGSISIAEDGQLVRGLTPATLTKELRERLTAASDTSIGSMLKLARTPA